MKSGSPSVSGTSRRNESCLLSILCVQGAFQRSRRQLMGRGGQVEPAGKSGITSNEKKGGVISCRPFPIP